MTTAGMSGSHLNINVGSGRYPMKSFVNLDLTDTPSRSWRPERQPGEVELVARVKQVEVSYV
jgi:hypothetical protein